MMSSQRSPLWPYLLVLTGLFVLSVAVPRGWHDPGRNSASQRDSLPRPAQTAAQWRPKNVGLPPATPVQPEPASTSSAPPAFQAVKRVPLALEKLGARLGTLALPEPPQLPRQLNDAPIREQPAEKIADSRRFGIPHNNLVDRIGEVNRIVDAADQSWRQNATEARSRDDALATAYWPVPESLLAQLDHLAQHVECLGWTSSVEDLCVTLCRVPPGDTEQAQQILRQLQALVPRAGSLAANLKDPRAAAELRRVAHALERRLRVWDIAFRAPRQGEVFANIPTGIQRRRELSEALAQANTALAEVPHADAWRTFLLLNELATLTNVGLPADEDKARELTRKAWLRLVSREATDAQRQVLELPALLALAERLRWWCAEPVHVNTVLASLERYETSARASDARQVAEGQRRLRWSPDPHHRELAGHLEDHYRNANLRMVITDNLLNRLVPEPQVSGNRISDNVLGTPVSGFGMTSTQLHVRLVPDPNRVHLWLEAQGLIDSQTRAYSGPATFSSSGEANYMARKAVLIDERGLRLAPTMSQADSDSWLTGLQTNYDGIPLIGPMVRNYARSQHNALRGDARQEVDAKVATQAGQRLNSEVNDRCIQAEQRIRKDALDPLDKLDVEVQPVRLETAEERITMRLRVAGEHQLGGHTPRPQAPSDSLASVQMHESAVNNVLDQLQLAGRTFELPDLYRHLTERTSKPFTLPEDAPDNVWITFSESDPVRMRCRDGGVELTLAIAELRQGQRRWHDFTITARYEPEIERLHARLARDGAIKLGGDTYKGQSEFVLRGIFSKILSRERKLDLVPATVANHPRLHDLCVSQCMLADGWIGLAIGPDRSVARSDVAQRPAAENK